MTDDPDHPAKQRARAERAAGRHPGGPGRGNKVAIGKGPGWGGPANGKPPRGEKSMTGPPAWLERGPNGAYLPTLKSIADAEIKDQIETLWYNVAMDETRDLSYRIVAGEKLVNSRIGLPVQRVVTQTVAEPAPIEAMLRGASVETVRVLRDALAQAEAEAEGRDVGELASDDE